MKKALIFDPYLDTLGGGERYSLTFANELIKYGFRVEVAWNDIETIRSAEERFGLNLSGIKLNKKAFDIFTQKTSFFKKLFFTLRYNLIFWVSDGSLPFLFSRNNLIHFQVPFKKIGGNPLLNKIKTLFIHKFVYNSLFTATVHEKNLPKNKSYILYPPIDTDSFRSGKKEDIILSAGRFDSPSHSKRQDVLIKAFRLLNKTHSEYHLILTGGNKGDSKIIDSLKTEAGNLPINFVVNPDFTKLKSLFAKSKFFWHAAGYEIDEMKDPEKVEHFGMTTVEAMSSGCVPIVIAKGGQKEIVTTQTGFLCSTPEEMAKETGHLIDSPKKLKELQQNLETRSKTFSVSEFSKKIKSLL
jgi:glycosyltransferase involved in cell wall biosynthesis